MPAKTKPKTKAKAVKSAAARANGRVLTVKQLDRKSYDAIHSLPRGQRGPALKTLLTALAKFRADSNADAAIAAGRIAIVETV
jgi:hypothetical protein